MQPRFKTIITALEALRRPHKEAAFLVLDLLLVPLALVITFALQAPSIPPLQALITSAIALPYLVALTAGASVVLGTHRIRLNAYEIKAVMRTGLVALYLGAGGGLIMELAGVQLPLGQYVVLGLIYFVMAAGLRMAMLHLLLVMYRLAQPRCRVLIYGAGATGTQLVQALSTHGQIVPVAFVDDNTALQGLTVAGLPIYTPIDIATIVDDRQIDRVLLAVPSLSAPKQAQIARRLQKLGLEVQTLPSFAQLIGEQPLSDKLTPVEPHSFLNRDEVKNDLGEDADIYADNVVLVSGAGGSIGSELCRQILACRPRKLVLYELSELALYNVEMELRALAAEDVEIVPVLGSVTDPRQVRSVLAIHKVEVVLHAAAYKHVPLVERNPLAGLANNVFGTQTLAQCAADMGVARFILISSDKAVRPVGVMGASKRLAELVVQDMASRVPKGGQPVYSMVRFGNVLGSSGSVVPMFQEQIKRGGPLTVTHPEVTRYFMTTQEAVRLVLRASAMAAGGEVFVLDMGAPVPIMRLAQQAIAAAGYSVRDETTPEGDIEIKITGLRPGEKLHEELTITSEHIGTTHSKIFCARETALSEIEVAHLLRSLRQAMATSDEQAARDIIRRWVESPENPENSWDMLEKL